MLFGVAVTSVTTGMNTDVCNFMFGSILAMKQSDVILSLVLSVTLVIVYIVFYHRLFLISFDEKFAKASGINVTFYQFLIALILCFL